jgi:hypothetical protein
MKNTQYSMLNNEQNVKECDATEDAIKLCSLTNKTF